jgi:eukaryotic-like serine/threonine-protein kinase
MTSRMSTSIPVVLNGRYELGSIIAEGGMSQVVRARDLRLGRDVAIKILRAHNAAASEALDRFRREARAAASLTHPNLVNVFDVGHDPSHGFHYIVMELLPGQTLKDLVADGPLSLEDAVVLTRQVAQGMAVAHRRGLVHRDLKPQNILLTEEGLAKVGDFGLVQAEENMQLTQPGTVWGTVQYLSPEQAQGLPADARSDVYALGTIFYELLTGRPPYQGATSASIMMKHVYDPPPDATEVNPAVPPAASRLAQLAMAKAPDARIQSMEALAQALGNLMDASAADTAIWDALARSERRGSVLPPDRRTHALAPPPGLTTRPSSSSSGSLGTSPPESELTGLQPSVRPARDERMAQRRVRQKRSRLPLILAGSLLLFFAMMAVGATMARDVFGLQPLPDRPLPTRTVPAAITPSPTQPTPLPTVVVIPVPNVLGQALDVAQARLTSASLTFEMVEDFSKDTPRGSIAEQDPPANARLEAGKPVRLTVSKGPPRAAVPPVVGMTFAEASEKMAGAGFKVQRQDEHNDRALTGTVFQQSLSGEADFGATISLKVSLGRNLVTVPEVRGRTEQEARQLLETEGFKIEVAYDRFPGVDPGQVFVAEPASMTRVERGTTVTIRVRRDPTPVPASATPAPAATATPVPVTPTPAPAASPTSLPPSPTVAPAAGATTAPAASATTAPAAGATTTPAAGATMALPPQQTAQTTPGSAR